MFEKYFNVISRTELFEDIDSQDILKVLACLNPNVISYQKGDHIVTQGDNFESIGILLSSEAKIYKVNLTGHAIMVKILKPGDIFGEVIVFSKHMEWPVTIEVQGDCEVLLIPKKTILQERAIACQWHKIIIANILRIISDRAIYLNERIDYLSIKSTRQKVSTYLLEQYKRIGATRFNLTLNRNELADFLNISRPTLSREMCKMRDEGIIAFNLKAIQIIDVQALKTCKNR